jgi:2-polyprenyl-3-methyl-5-hydroxy-6-metoxy-1,4-benzoquinol methylase
MRAFDELLRQTERNLRRSGQTVPAQGVLDVVRDELFALTDLLETIVADDPGGRDSVQRDYDTHVGPWIFRSELYWRSRFRPHGYAGDYAMIEQIYDLEQTGGVDPTQAAILSCLDYAYAGIDCVADLWERRHRFSDTLKAEFARVGPSMRVLDVACGGARYLHDFVCADPAHANIDITLVDQDSAALVFARRRLLEAGARNVTALSLPIARLPQALVGEWDVVLSAGLFDYLQPSEARGLLAAMTSVLSEGGLVALSNYHPDDTSQFFRDIVAHWVLVHRTEAEVAGLFPSGTDVQTSLSASGGLVFGSMRKA